VIAVEVLVATLVARGRQAEACEVRVANAQGGRLLRSFLSDLEMREADRAGGVRTAIELVRMEVRDA
jgi:hypothetical protein